MSVVDNEIFKQKRRAKVFQMIRTFSSVQLAKQDVNRLTSSVCFQAFRCQVFFKLGWYFVNKIVVYQRKVRYHDSVQRCTIQGSPPWLASHMSSLQNVCRCLALWLSLPVRQWEWQRKKSFIKLAVGTKSLSWNFVKFHHILKRHEDWVLVLVNSYFESGIHCWSYGWDVFHTKIQSNLQTLTS
jgi:hypothetical protein